MESLGSCFSPSAYVGGMNLSHKIFFARWDFLLVPFPPKHIICLPGGVTSEVCCLPVEDMANSRLRRVNAVVTEKNEGWPVPLCAACMGNKWLMLWTACYRLLTAWDPTVAADVWPVIIVAGVWGHGAGKMLGCVQKETTALGNVLKMYHLARS